MQRRQISTAHLLFGVPKPIGVGRVGSASFNGVFRGPNQKEGSARDDRKHPKHQEERIVLRRRLLSSEGLTAHRFDASNQGRHYGRHGHASRRHRQKHFCAGPWRWPLLHSRRLLFLFRQGLAIQAVLLDSIGVRFCARARCTFGRTQVERKRYGQHQREHSPANRSLNAIEDHVQCGTTRPRRGLN